MIYSPSYSKDPEIREEFLRLAAVVSTLAEGKLQVAYNPPKKLKPGLVLICDGVLWNPLGDGISRPVWYTGLEWQPFGGLSGGGGTVVGLPQGGLQDQVLTKISSADYDAAWEDLPEGSGGEPPTVAPTIAARVEKTTPQLISTSTVTVSYQTVVRDDGGLYNPAQPTRLTAPEAGWYCVQTGYVMTENDTDGNISAWIVKSGESEEIIGSSAFRSPTNSSPRVNISVIDYFLQGESVYVRTVRTTSSSGISLLASPETFLAMFKL